MVSFPCARCETTPSWGVQWRQTSQMQGRMLRRMRTQPADVSASYTLLLVPESILGTENLVLKWTSGRASVYAILPLIRDFLSAKCSALFQGFSHPWRFRRCCLSETTRRKATHPMERCHESYDQLQFVDVIDWAKAAKKSCHDDVNRWKLKDSFPFCFQWQDLAFSIRRRFCSWRQY